MERGSMAFLKKLLSTPTVSGNENVGQRLWIDYVKRYADADLELNRHHAEITGTEIERFRTLATELLQQSDDLWRDAVGKMLSDSAVTASEDDEQPIYVSDLLSGVWIRHPETRMFYHQSKNNIEVYYNGRVHEFLRVEERVEFVEPLVRHIHRRPVRFRLARGKGRHFGTSAREGVENRCLTRICEANQRDLQHRSRFEYVRSGLQECQYRRRRDPRV